MAPTLAQNVIKPSGETQFVESVGTPAHLDFNTVSEEMVYIEGEDSITAYTVYLCCIASIAGLCG